MPDVLRRIIAVVQLLERIPGDAPSGRLCKARVETCPATSAGAWAMQFCSPGLLLLSAELRRDGDVEESKSDPRSIAMTALQRHLDPRPQGDVRHVATPEEEIAGPQAVTLGQITAFHRDFYGASAGELAIVGDFDPATVEPLVRGLFGDWKSARPCRRLASSWREIAPMTERIALQDSDPDDPALLWPTS